MLVSIQLNVLEGLLAGIGTVEFSCYLVFIVCALGHAKMQPDFYPQPLRTCAKLCLHMSVLTMLICMNECLQTWALWKFSRYLILTALPFKLCNDASQFVAPTFLSLLLGVVSSGQPSSLGYMYATVMLALLITGTLCDSQHFQRVMRAGEQTKMVELR